MFICSEFLQIVDDINFVCLPFHIHELKGVYAEQQLDFLANEVTGTRQLPMVFVDRQYIGGYAQFHQLKEMGKLQPGNVTCKYETPAKRSPY